MHRSGDNLLDARPRFADQLRFLRNWAARPRTVGAVAASGRALSAAMARGVDPNGTLPVLELGPGTGVVTHALLERGVAPERIVAIEYDPDFHALLRRRFPRVNFIRGDAYDLRYTLPAELQGPFASVVSSLPLILQPPERRLALVEDALSRLAPGGSMIQFSYALKPPVGALPGRFTLARSRWILRNIPPARVWTYRPEKPATQG